jgi:hypothetical protein
MSCPHNLQSEIEYCQNFCKAVSANIAPVPVEKTYFVRTTMTPVPTAVGPTGSAPRVGRTVPEAFAT